MTHTERRERRAAVIAAVQLGESDGDVARRFDLNVIYVARLRAASGVKRPGRHHPKYALIADLIGTAETLTALASKYSVSKEAVRLVYQQCRDHGIPVQERPHSRPRESQS